MTSHLRLSSARMPSAVDRGVRSVLTLLVATASIAGFAQAAPLPVTAPAAPPAVVVDEEATLREFERRGRDLYRADRAAWLTTDQLFAQGFIDAGTRRLKDVPGDPDGWVTSPDESPDIWRVAYVTMIDGEPRSFADGTVDFAAEPLASLRANAPPRPLEHDEVAQRAIRQDALRRDWMACSESPYNSATLPDGRGGWFVYLMPPQKSGNVYPMGGFHRFRYDADGRFVEQYAHTRGCLDQDMTGAPEGEATALFITHLTTPTPNEFHAFMSLTYRLPVFVVTGPDALWKVEDGRIGRVEEDAAADEAR